MELYRTLRLGEKFRNFMELFNVSYGTEQLWPISEGQRPTSLVAESVSRTPKRVYTGWPKKRGHSVI